MRKNSWFLAIFLLLIISIVVLSYQKQREANNLQLEHKKLSLQVDSLHNFINQFEVLTVLNNNNFTLKLGEVYSVESMAVLKEGLVLDSLFLNQNRVPFEGSILRVEKSMFGPKISFRPDSIGVYTFSAFVSSFAWKNGTHSVKTEWTVRVEK